jgi:hypothetical protein
VSAVRELEPSSGRTRHGIAAVRWPALLLLAVSAAFVGFWALLAPASFYRSFPGLGYTWVSEAGPYDEHLVRDVGALYLALLAVTLIALARPGSARPWVAGVAWLVFGVPHLVFHAAHAGRGDVAEIALLAASVLLAAVACLPDRGRSKNMP